MTINSLLWSHVAVAWVPFLQPMPMDDYWLLFMIPLVIAIAVVYKTIRTDNLTRLPRAAGYLATQIVVFMVLAAAALWLITELV